MIGRPVNQLFRDEIKENTEANDEKYVSSYDRNDECKKLLVEPNDKKTINSSMNWRGRMAGNKKTSI